MPDIISSVDIPDSLGRSGRTKCPSGILMGGRKKIHTFYYILHYTQHYTLNTLHSSLCLYTLHSTLYTLHSTLYTLNSTLYTLHSTLYSVQCILYTILCKYSVYEGFRGLRKVRLSRSHRSHCLTDLTVAKLEYFSVLLR